MPAPTERARLAALIDTRPRRTSFDAFVRGLMHASDETASMWIEQAAARVASWPALARRGWSKALEVRPSLRPLIGTYSHYVSVPCPDLAAFEGLEALELTFPGRAMIGRGAQPSWEWLDRVPKTVRHLALHSVHFDDEQADRFVQSQCLSQLTSLELRYGEVDPLLKRLGRHGLPVEQLTMRGPSRHAALRLLRSGAASGLKHIDVRERWDRQTLEAVLQRQRVESLALGGWSTRDGEELRLILDRAPADLHSLAIKGGTLRGETACELFGQLAHPLRHLELQNLQLLDSLDLIGAGALRGLEHLTVSSAFVGDRDAAHLAESQLKLRELVLSGCDIGPRGSAALFGALNGVEVLALDQAPVGDRFATELAAQLDVLSTLVELRIDDGYLSASAVGTLAVALTHHASRLAVFKTGGSNGVDGDGIKALRALERRGVDVAPRRHRPFAGEAHDGSRPSQAWQTAKRPEAQVDNPWPRIDRWLRTHAPDTWAALHPPMRDERVMDKLRTRLDGHGLAIPPDLIDFWRAHDGAPELSGFLKAAEAPRQADWARYFWLLSAERATQEHWTMLDLGIDWPLRNVPIGADGGGNVLLVDAQSQEVFVWDHESTERTRVAIRLGAWFGTIADRMEAGLIYESEDGLEVDDAPPAVSTAAPPDELAPARRLLTLLIGNERIALADGAELETLVRALADALRRRALEQRAKALSDLLDGAEEVEDYFLDDEEIRVLAREFG